MSIGKEFELIYEGNVIDYEERLIRNAEQELLQDKPGKWCKVANQYTRQLTIISYNPYPEEEDPLDNDDVEGLPSIKHIYMNTEYPNFYRWGFQGGRTGNHRIIYAIHNYYRVIMLHYFDKHYNGSIKRDNIIPAEVNYENYCKDDPNLY
ncbi:hypothetical protein [Oceanobacillus halophilus]|uniref:Uncharacterized protein n=1 Tax=Oceanobacillus halophilus TaxID=930130 RepID=A0A494ZTK8_9BACI|nr:hypothetical protein [Oceanobacillus halophilus]RKQ28665.1 hypothetical protein D8M06_18515 [Oceanobacillus halophilus]